MAKTTHLRDVRRSDGLDAQGWATTQVPVACSLDIIMRRTYGGDDATTDLSRVTCRECREIAGGSR